MERSLEAYAERGGCSCKLGPHIVREIAAQAGAVSGGAVLVGIEHGDDAGVYQIGDDLAMIQTVDFFTPLIADPYEFGRIAAANALSDIYAMGGRPATALNLVAFPVPLVKNGTLAEVLRGGADIAREAGVQLIGGHSIEDEMPKYGMAVTGFCNPKTIWKNSGAHPGDILVLTKPIGTGILTLAGRGGLFLEAMEVVVQGMTVLNKKACETAQKLVVHACTDITGYSLMGHGAEMAKGSRVTLEIDHAAIPLYSQVKEAGEMGFIPAAAYGNKKVLEGIAFAETVPEVYRDICFDPQTSGGLLFALPRKDADSLLAALPGSAWEIGRAVKEKGVYVYVK